MKKICIYFLLALFGTAYAHSINPQRLSSSETGTIRYTFLAMNLTDSGETYEIEVYFHDIKENNIIPIEFAAKPEKLYVGAKTNRQFLVQFEAEKPGRYLVCTKQKPNLTSSVAFVTTRVCARVQVAGVPE